MPKYSRNILVALKKEASYGVAETLVGANCFQVITDPGRLTALAGNTASRDFVRSYKGNSSTIQTEQYRQFAFDVELQSSGTAGTAPKFADALLACGMAETVTAATKVEYAPVSSNEDSITIDPYLDGILFQMLGARGNAKISLPGAGIPKLMFDFMGNYVAASDATPLTADFTGWQVPLGVNSANTPTVTLFGKSLCMTSFELDFGNGLVHLDHAGCSPNVQLPTRAATGTIVFQLPAIAVKDWVEAARTKESGALQIIHGTAAGYIVQIDAPKVTLNPPSLSDQNGIMYASCPLIFEPTSAGNDEIKITFK